MSNQFEAIGLNNHAVSLLERGSLWDAFDTCHYALACLDDEQERKASCQCRLLNTTGSLHTMFAPTSVLRDHSMNAARDLLCEGKQCQVIGYEWVDCKPKLQDLDDSSMDEDGNGAQNQSNKAWTHPSFPSCQHKPTHDSRLAFLSLGVVKVRCNPYGEERRPHHLQCDCATRWAVMHNLGVIHHTLALTMGERGHPLLQEAHRFYLTAQLTIPALTSLGDILRLLLSSHNNQISIYQEFAMHPEYRAALQLLTELLASIPSYAIAATDLEPSKVMDHEILLNLMVLTRNESAPAA